MTPCQLDVLLHYFVNQGNAVQYPSMQRSAVKAAHMRMVRNGYLEVTPLVAPHSLPSLGKPVEHKRYSITSRGFVWAEAILNTPEPVAVWLDSSGNVITTEDL